VPPEDCVYGEDDAGNAFGTFGGVSSKGTYAVEIQYTPSGFVSKYPVLGSFDECGFTEPTGPDSVEKGVLLYVEEYTFGLGACFGGHWW